eukprot:CAMPEP_0201504996 /NCGR_PEP_ID=MMETSP0151_2-20130828/85518_1 /ASSEMBLY_ACC=CAM_ASM_000257 /TAXON_ID=200890 /ORGANISM="Paramoeba atlantica, Strain 621/1 / CCAP 1560/9" /LENGTH=133 /DNA_ID=CAMNT_0047898811 /DNA_START=1940 /DNA_END=2338 /DNA_ORIENTATION=-
MSHQSNYASYRAYLKGSTPPCVPYLGVVLSDLTFIDDGNKDYDGELLNLQKWRMISDVVGRLMYYQIPSYEEIFPQPYMNFGKALAPYEVLSAEELSKLSSLIEPKNQEEAFDHLLQLYHEAQNCIAELKKGE